jgi:hypothetical protein
MITVFDMATGELLHRSESKAAPIRVASNVSTGFELAQPALQEVESHRPAVRMPPDLAALDIAEVLAKFR